MSTEAPLLYDIPSAAVALTLSRRTVEKLIAAGSLETVKIGRSRRIPAQALADYIEHLRRTA